MINKEEIKFFRQNVGRTWDKTSLEVIDAQKRIKVLQETLIQAGKQAAKILFGPDAPTSGISQVLDQATIKKFRSYLPVTFSPKNQFQDKVLYWLVIEGRSEDKYADKDIFIYFGLRDDSIKNNALKIKNKEISTIFTNDLGRSYIFNTQDEWDADQLTTWIVDSVNSLPISYEDFCRKLQPELDEEMVKQAAYDLKKSSKLSKKALIKPDKESISLISGTVAPPLNIIYYGPPGTGKTFTTKRKAVEICLGVASDDRDQVNIQYEMLRKQNRIEFITFHQSYSYEDFVEGLRPVISDTSAISNLGYECRPGVFKRICTAARKINNVNKNTSSEPNVEESNISKTIPENFVLIIDEINRANISKVFGELISLIENDKRIGNSEQLMVRLPYSQDREFGVPKNLYIIGTMNTADRSISLMDTALRRRFEFIEIGPDYSAFLEVNNPIINDETNIAIDLRYLLMSINDRIEFLIGRDQRIGHAYLLHIRNLEELNRCFLTQVIPLLQEYFYEDWSKIAKVLSVPTGIPNFINKRATSATSLFSSPPDDFGDKENQDNYHMAPNLTGDMYRGLYAGREQRFLERLARN